MKKFIEKLKLKLIKLVEYIHLKFFGKLVLLCLVFIYGFVCHSRQIFPFTTINKVYINAFRDRPNNDNHDRVNFDDEAFKKLQGSIVEIDSLGDITKKRKELIRFIWKDRGFPNKKQPKVIKNIVDDKYSNITNLKNINKLRVDMEYGIYSDMYWFSPVKSNNKLVIYHQGHGGDFFKGKNTIAALIDNGYTVIAVSMPLLGMNNQPKIKTERWGTIKFDSHNQFQLLDDEDLSPIKFFIEPVIVAVNYAVKEGFRSINMIGISGGGWTTVLASAVESRIIKSYSVAGSYPFFLRSKSFDENLGDYEQSNKNLYKVANYLELYIMAGYNNGRKHVQVLNIYDSCCFRGRKYLAYKDMIYKKIEQLGSVDFIIHTDDTHSEHKISTATIKFILNDLGE